MKVTIGINNNKEIKVLPVIKTDSINIDFGSSTNENSDSVKYGQIKVLGAEPLATVSIDSFFPTHSYGFLASGSTTDALGYISWFRDGRKNRKPFRVVVTDNSGKTIFNRLMALETFSVSEIDRAGDYTYSMQFEQYREV